MVMDAINSGAESAAQAIGLIKPKKAKLLGFGPPFPEDTPPH